MTEPIPPGGPSSSGLPNQPLSPPGSPPVTLPERLGSFVLLDKLGEGGMGFVHRGQQDGLDRIVAVKILTPHLAMDPLFVARFHREAKAAAVLEHPNVVRIYASGDENGFHYFATEFMGGGSVEDLMTTDRLIPPRRALEIVRDIAGALAFASTRGIVHRDIKPANILLSEQGIAKLADLGLAKRTDPDQTTTHLTQAGMIMGTPYYMAPEQALDEGTLDIRADIYALGITLFQMLSGQVPFSDPSDDGDTASAMVIMTRKVNKQVPSVRSLNPAIGQPLADLCERMTANDRNQRFPDADTLLAACSAMLAGQVPGSVATNQTAGGMDTPVPAAASTDPNAIPPPAMPTPSVPMPPAATPTTRTSVPPARGSKSHSSRAIKRAPRRRHPTSSSRRIARVTRSGKTSSTRLAAVMAGREQSQIPPWAWLGIGAAGAAAFLLGMAILGGDSAPPQPKGSTRASSRRARTPANPRESSPAPRTSESPREPPLRPRREASSAEYRLPSPAKPDPTPAIEDARPENPAPPPPNPVVREPAASILPMESPRENVQDQVKRLVASWQWAAAIRLADDAASGEQDANLARRHRTLAAILDAIFQLSTYKPRQAMEALDQIKDRTIAEEITSDLDLAAPYQLVLIADSLRAGDEPQARFLLKSAREKNAQAIQDVQQVVQICDNAERAINSLVTLRDIAFKGATKNFNRRIANNHSQLAKFVDAQLLTGFEAVLRAREQLLRPHRNGIDLPRSWAEELEAASSPLAALEDDVLLGSQAADQVTWLTKEIAHAVEELRNRQGIWVSMGDPTSTSELTNASDQFEISDHETRSIVTGETAAAALCRLPILRLKKAASVKGISVSFQVETDGRSPPLISLQFDAGHCLLIGSRLAAIRGNLNAGLLRAVLQDVRHGNIGDKAKVKLSRDRRATLLLQRAPPGGNINQMQLGFQRSETSDPKFLNPITVRWGNSNHIDLRIGNGVRVSHLVINR